jgi:hypothetical protein
VRANALFNRLLGFTGTVVESVSFTDQALVVEVRLRSQLLICPCGRSSRARYDTSVRQWRHVNLGRWKVYIRARIRRVDCRGCGQVRTEWMPFGRPGARHTRDFEDLAGWLAKRMSKAATAAEQPPTPPPPEQQTRSRPCTPRRDHPNPISPVPAQRRPHRTKILTAAQAP